jgi:nitronate monooxygenase
MGADMITVVGYENGGATGKLDIGTIVLIPRIAEAVKVPVIGGGGISDGRGFLAALALGAQGVIIGTRLLATQEAPIHIKVKEALVNASELDTMLVLRSLGATHRAYTNAAAKKCVELEDAREDVAEILKVVSGENAKRLYDTGDMDAGILPCGQGVGLVHDVPTIKELFDRIVQEASDLARNLANT